MEKKANRQRFFLKVILPSVVTLTLFVAAVFLIIIPSFRRAMLMEKKEMIRELAETAWSILNESYELEKKGELSEKKAKSRAVAGINGLRYGHDMKDYFWVCDMAPKMVIHPYRPELNGKDMSDFKDAHNKKVFVEFVEVVKKQKEGYVEYYWQWNDDPRRIAPKLSYVKGFTPWGWIIGTGIYLEDVEAEIGAISHKVIVISVIIAMISFLLMFLVIYHSHSIEQDRYQSQLALKESKEKYQALVESSSEAFILILDKKLNYANNAALDILRCNEVEFLKLDITDIISPDKSADRDQLNRLIEENGEETHFETVLQRHDAKTVDAVLSISKVFLQDKTGFIIIVKEVSAELLNSKLSRQRRIAEEQKKLIVDLQNKNRLAGDGLPDWEAAAKSSSAEELIKLRQEFPVKLKSLIDSGINVENLTGINGKMIDAVNIRFIELAITELGAPPVPFSFMVFGSQGRCGQTLKTDQDNAIIYHQPDNDKDNDKVKSYFLALGTKVCDWLDKAGYPYCGGGNMAKNEKWVLTLAEWKECFNDWIYNASPDNLLRVNIFFDFRTVYGDSSLTDELWEYIEDAIEDRPEFFLHFVQDALLYKPPITIFGNIALRDKGKKKETISLKEVNSAIVQFARIYALKHRIHETNTLERLRELRDHKFIKNSTYREISEVYNLLMEIRFKHQAEMMDNGEQPDNRVNPKLFTDIEQEILKKSFAAISSFQTKISYDFKGIM